MNAKLKDQIRRDWHYADVDDPLDVVSIEGYQGDIDGVPAQPGDVFVSDGVSGVVYRPANNEWSRVWKNS